MALLLPLVVACGGGTAATPIVQPILTPTTIPTLTATPAPTPTSAPVVLPPTATNTPVPTFGEVEVSIDVQDAFNLGSLQLELSYDPQVLDLQEVRAGHLARNALVDSNRDSLGLAARPRII